MQGTDLRAGGLDLVRLERHGPGRNAPCRSDVRRQGACHLSWHQPPSGNASRVESGYACGALGVGRDEPHGAQARGRARHQRGKVPSHASRCEGRWGQSVRWSAPLAAMTRLALHVASRAPRPSSDAGARDSPVTLRISPSSSVSRVSKASASASSCARCASSSRRASA